MNKRIKTIVLQKALVFTSALADHQVLQPIALLRSLRLVARRSSGLTPRRSLPANHDAQVSPRQLHCAGLSLPISPGPHTGRSLPANHAAQVSPRKLRRAGLSPPIAPRRSLPANRAWTALSGWRPANRAFMALAALSMLWLHWTSCKTRSPALSMFLRMVHIYTLPTLLVPNLTFYDF